MAAPFNLDYSSFGGAAPAECDPAAVLDGWKAFLPGFDATHHQIGNLQIESSETSAKVECYVTATHVISGAAGGAVWTVVGIYFLPLIREGDGWKLTGCRLQFKYQDGNTGLPTLAQTEMRRRS